MIYESFHEQVIALQCKAQQDYENIQYTMISIRDILLRSYKLYILNKLLALFLYAINEDELKKNIELFFSEYWKFMQKSTFYTAIPDDQLTCLLCDLADALATKEKPAINILMPDVCTESYVGYPSLHEMDLKKILRTHILGKDGAYLIPISLLSTLDLDSLSVKYWNPYFDENKHSSDRRELDQSEIDRLFDHSEHTKALKELLITYQNNRNDPNHMLGVLNILCTSLYQNSIKAKGTESDAFCDIYSILISFREYYDELDESIKKRIPDDVVKEINTLMKATFDLESRNSYPFVALTEEEFKTISKLIQSNLESNNKIKQVNEAIAKQLNQHYQQIKLNSDQAADLMILLSIKKHSSLRDKLVFSSHEDHVSLTCISIRRDNLLTSMRRFEDMLEKIVLPKSDNKLKNFFKQSKESLNTSITSINKLKNQCHEDIYFGGHEKLTIDFIINSSSVDEFKGLGKEILSFNFFEFLLNGDPHKYLSEAFFASIIHVNPLRSLIPFFNKLSYKDKNLVALFSSLTQLECDDRKQEQVVLAMELNSLNKYSPSSNDRYVKGNPELRCLLFILKNLTPRQCELICNSINPRYLRELISDSEDLSVMANTLGKEHSLLICKVLGKENLINSIGRSLISLSKLLGSLPSEHIVKDETIKAVIKHVVSSSQQLNELLDLLPANEGYRAVLLNMDILGYSFFTQTPSPSIYNIQTRSLNNP